MYNLAKIMQFLNKQQRLEGWKEKLQLNLDPSSRFNKICQICNNNKNLMTYILIFKMKQASKVLPPLFTLQPKMKIRSEFFACAFHLRRIVLSSIPSIQNCHKI